MLLRRVAHGAIRTYQLTLSSLVGRQCRHWPSCSHYTDAAIQRYGLWAGGWIGVARICRCGPFGTHGIDLVPEALPARAAWFTPWRYGRWRGVNAPPSPFSGESFSGESFSPEPFSPESCTCGAGRGGGGA
jgi:putative membrane protein insertion efficiency factor